MAVLFSINISGYIPADTDIRNFFSEDTEDGIQYHFTHDVYDHAESESEITYKESSNGTACEVFDLLRQEKSDCIILHLAELPSVLPDDVVIAALLHRSDPSAHLYIAPDAYDEAKDLKLKDQITMGVSSAIIGAQIKVLKPGINQHNTGIGTMIKELKNGNVQAAAANNFEGSIIKKKFPDFTIVRLNPKEVIPRPGEGVIACVCLRDNIEMRKILKTKHRPEISRCTNVERKTLKLATQKAISEMSAYCVSDQNGYLHGWAAALIPETGVLKSIFLSQSTSVHLPENIFNKLQNS
jgi:hydroxymethylbilane synthase